MQFCQISAASHGIIRCRLKTHFDTVDMMMLLYLREVLDTFGLITNFKGQEVCVFSTASRLPPGSNKPVIQLVPGALSPGLKRPGREADHSVPPSAEVTNGGFISLLYVSFSWLDA
jgi:hypothetical protein